MFILPGIFGLILFIFVRPFEFFESVRSIPFLYLFFGLSVFGYLVDLRLGTIKARFTPLLKWAVIFLGWCTLTAIIRAPGTLADGIPKILVLFTLFYVLAHGIQSFRVFESLVALVLASSLLIATVCAHQGFQPTTCVMMDRETRMESGDGRPCQTDEQCNIDPPEPTADYRCDKVGVLGITAISNRVRYVGILQDPNEVALVVSCALPLAFAFYQRRRSALRLAYLLFAIGVTAVCLYFTQSRGGQLVFIAVLGVYFVQKYQWKGGLAAVIAGAPMLIFRQARADADESSIERLECWAAGLEMWRSSPLYGIGFGQFTEHHHLTAHNSFVLAVAELGFVGLFLWTCMLYYSALIAWRALRDLASIPEAEVARTWAVALLASIIGLTIGVFFLSFNYHYAAWVFFGIAGALYSSVKMHKPNWNVRLQWHDLLIMVVFDVGLVGALLVYTRIKVGG